MIFHLQAERLAKQISIEDPYSWSKAQEYDAMTMETFVRNNARTQSVRDTIQAACRSVIGTLKETDQVYRDTSPLHANNSTKTFPS